MQLFKKFSRDFIDKHRAVYEGLRRESYNENIVLFREEYSELSLRELEDNRYGSRQGLYAARAGITEAVERLEELLRRLALRCLTIPALVLACVWLFATNDGVELLIALVVATISASAIAAVIGFIEIDQTLRRLYATCGLLEASITAADFRGLSQVDLDRPIC